MHKISIITTSIRPEGLEVVRQSILEQSFKDIEWLVDINWTGKHDLNAAYNRCIMRAGGELIVSWQDYIKAPQNALQTLWEAYQKEPKTMFTCPVGKTTDWENIKYDWRATRQELDIPSHYCEFDFACFSKQSMFDIGGFDEQLDSLWSMDNISVCKRAEMLGYSFKNIPELKVVAYDHDSTIEHPFRKDYKPALSNMIMDEYINNPVLSYLTLTDIKS